MENLFSFKDFENVSLKATYDLEIGSKKISKGEVIAYFDRIQIANLKEEIARVSANGGFDNRARVYWETTQEITLNFKQGVFSSIQLALLLNSHLIEGQYEEVLCSIREILESNSEGIITLAHSNVNNIFVYNKLTGERIEPVLIDENKITIDESFCEVIVDYNFMERSDNKIYLLGQNLLNGFVELEGTTRIKDDTTGKVVTGIIKIPKLKLMSNLSIRLGANATPFAGEFQAVGIPIGARGNSRVGEFIILDHEVTNSI